MRIIIRILVVAAAIIIPVLLQCLISGKKTNRAYHPAMPLFTLLFSIVSTIYISKNFNSGRLTESLLSFFKNADIVLVNSAVIISNILAKIVFKPVLQFIWKRTGITKHTAPPFYSFDDDYREWFLNKKWSNFRKVTFGIVCGCTISTITFLCLTWILGKGSFIWYFSLPASALIVIVEIYSYINGLTKIEYEHSIDGDSSRSRKVRNFYKLREILESLFPEPLISSYTSVEYSGKATPADMIRNLKKSSNISDRVTAEYFEINERCKMADVDCFKATLDMMHRRNVVFFNPFYKDLSMYIILPLVRSLLAGKKAVIITGRNSQTDDVAIWIQEIVCSYSHISSLWTVAKLNEQPPTCEIGVMSFQQLYNNRIISENKDLFNETDFVILIEPSAILGTGQIPLSIIAKEMHCFDEKPVYCICDRNVDGLVDTMSHILHADLTDVSAPPIPKCVFTGMSWDADGDFLRQQLFDKQTRYLGNGIELSAVAIKNQIPNAVWLSESRSPLRDIRWIAGQYYPTICKCMNLPAQQEKMYEKIEFIPTMWSLSAKKEAFIIAEDEFCNLFSSMRAFISRGTSNSFVNVLSENYLMRDYMRCNKQMFISNPNAIPSIVPDYAKTERNTLIKLILTMVFRPVSDNEIIDELRLVGIETNDPIDILARMLKKYTFASPDIFRVQRVKVTGSDFSSVVSCQYTISQDTFSDYFSDSLKTAYYIVEDEKTESDFIDAKMFNHVTQQILPSQFVTYNGKYYSVHHISPQNGVVLRRAADLYNGRRYYRQIRKYHLYGDEEVLRIRTIIDIEIAQIQMDFSAETTGYVDMNDYHDLRTARIVDFSDDPEFITYTRRYHNKDVLRINLPNTTIKERFTFCLILSELFRTLFPDSWQYIAVTSYQPSDIGGMLNYAVYSADGISEDSSYIYIIEDSEIDFGLLEAIDRNFIRIMEITADYLDWHMEKMREPAIKDPLPPEAIKRTEADSMKKTLFQRMATRIFKLFGKKGDKKDDVITFDESIENRRKYLDSSKAASSSLPKKEMDYFSMPHKDFDTMSSNSGISGEPTNNNLADITCIDGTDIFENEGMPEDDALLELQFKAIGIIPLEKTRYQKNCYLKYGFEEIDGRIQIDELKKYLRVHGFCNNSLTKARKHDVKELASINIKAENNCDFCGLPLNSISYELLNDGRIRCNDCSSSAINTVEEFKELYYQTLGLMQAFFSIQYHVSIKIITTDARKIAKGYGSVFKPTTKYATRVLGYAQFKNGKYSLLIENGSPRLSTVETMVHEMTHIWQYINWNKKQVSALYAMSESSCTKIADDIVYEGMAVWAAIQFLYQTGETFFAAQLEEMSNSRKDVYGIGFRLYNEQYPIVKDSSLLGYTPFSCFPPLEPEVVKDAVRSACRKEHCNC